MLSAAPSSTSSGPATGDPAATAASGRRWHDLAQWRILDTGFGTGARFLAAWQAWRADPGRPRLLHYVALLSHPPPAALLDTTGDSIPPALRAALVDQWHGLLPGFHRLSFDDAHVLLTLCIGAVRPMLRAQHFEADEIVVDATTLTAGDATTTPEAGPDVRPSPAPPDDPGDLAKAFARFARIGTRITIDVAAAANVPALALRGMLERQGFRMRPDEDAALPVRATAPAGWIGEFAPPWQVRRRPVVATAPLAGGATTPGHCVVVGAGLAGAAVAASLARRGWRVTVLDAEAQAATGASGVPAGVFAPHVSSDDALLSRLTRAGLRLMRRELQIRLREGVDWHDGGVLERRAPGTARLPADWRAEGPNESWHATPERLAAHHLPADVDALWHTRAGWARPDRLVAAWLALPGITLRTRAPVARIEPVDDHDPDRDNDQDQEESGADGDGSGSSGDGDGDGDGGRRSSVPMSPMPPVAAEPGATATDVRHPSRWALFDAEGRCLVADADRVVVAAGAGTIALAQTQPLQRVRGQLAWGRIDRVPGLADTLPATALNGDGHLVAHVPDPAGAFWLTGATFDRDRGDRSTCAADAAANLARLARLHPATHALLMRDPSPTDHLQAWAGVRCASADRRPLVGPLRLDAPSGPWLCTAMGSRGLSFAVLCAELLAARWHGEPLPLPAALAQALDTARTARVPRASGKGRPPATPRS
ncbi:MAG: FAD-dependent oxidoreductase [Variovorax sp.]|nr:MAG: FAD-dependent oxidoreductase [Variovorax sp.]